MQTMCDELQGGKLFDCLDLKAQHVKFNGLRANGYQMDTNIFSNTGLKSRRNFAPLALIHIQCDSIR